jgi:type I restriction enzyme S subunit
LIFNEKNGLLSLLSSYYEKIGTETRCIDEEIPFEVPEGWEWVRLKDISEVYLGKTLDKQKNKGDYKTYLRSVNIRWGSVDLDDIKEMKFEQSELEKYELQIGDLLICEGGEVGRCAIWDKNISMRFQNAIHRARFHKEINPYFYMYVIWHYNDILLLKDISRGVTIQHLTGQALDSLFFPLPPITEQHRIVLHIEELMFQIDKYDKTEQRLVAFDTNFPDTLKKSILQSAIQGKLVAQDPDDEPVSVLLEKIRKERETLTKDGKLKRDKTESYIYKNTEDNSYYEKIGSEIRCIDEEVPFEIASSWLWVRLGNICNTIHYGFTASASQKGNSKLLRITDIQDNKVDWKSVPFCMITEHESVTYKLNKNDILIARTGGTIGKTYIIDNLKEKAVFASYLIRAVPNDNIYALYLKYYMESPFYWQQLTQKSMGTGQPNVNGESLKSLLVPLPSLCEQKEIVEAIDNIFNLINEIA